MAAREWGNRLKGGSMTDAKTSSDTLGSRAARGPSRSAEDIARMGSEIYERDIRPQVEADHDGEIVAIDVDSGEWVVAADSMAATDRLRAQRPDATDVYCEWVGYRAMYSFGGAHLRRTN